MSEDINESLPSSSAEPWFVSMPWPGNEGDDSFQEVVMATSREDAIDQITKRMKKAHPSFSLRELREESPIDCLRVSDQLTLLLSQAYGVDLRVDAGAIRQFRQMAASQKARDKASRVIKLPLKIVTEIGASESLNWSALPTYICVNIGHVTLQRWWSAYAPIRAHGDRPVRNYVANLYWDAIDYDLLCEQGEGVEVERSPEGTPLESFNLDDCDVRLEGPHIRIEEDGDVQVIFQNKHGDGKLWCRLTNLEDLASIEKVLPQAAPAAGAA